MELKPAIDRTISQVLALVSLNPDHLTLSGAVLDQLAAAQSVEAADQEPKPHHIELDLESLGLEDREIPPEKLTKLEKIGSGGFKDVFIGKFKGRRVAIAEFRGQLSQSACWFSPRVWLFALKLRR